MMGIIVSKVLIVLCLGRWVETILKKIGNLIMKHISLPSEIGRDHEVYFSDKRIADMLSVSSSWVRKQRYLRNKGEDSLFPLDPTYRGASPRYKSSDVLSWISGLQE